MIAKRLLDKIMKQNTKEQEFILSNLDLQVAIHYGVPFTASILAFDPFQRLLAIGTLDGRIKIIGGNNIEGLLLSPKKVPYKHLEFLHNQGCLVGVTNENEIQAWNLEYRQLVHCFQWEANITAFSVICGTYLMYVGDENGLLSVLKYAEGEILKFPYQLSASDLPETAGISFVGTQSIVGILPQLGTSSSRVLVAYEKDLLVLWDIDKREAVTVRSYANLRLKGAEAIDQLESYDTKHEEDNEICSICWVSDNNSIAAVGYINGDVLLWDFTTRSSMKGQQLGVSSSNVVKLQLASGDRRLPVIVLHWSVNSKGNNEKGGQLFIYGGDEIGSEEVLAVLTLEWSSGIETLKLISRVNLNLNGSFADMILIPDVVSEKISTAALFVLTNPGQLNVYDGTILSVLQSGRDPSAQGENLPAVVPTVDPKMTVAKFCLLSKGSSSSKVLFEKFHSRTIPSCTLSAGTKWPLTGGVPPEVSCQDYEVEKLFLAGYQDGSVRIWDVTYPILVPIFLLEGKLPAVDSDVAFSAVSAVAFCSSSMTLAIGNEFGLVRIYKLQENSNGSSFHFVTEANHEVHMVQHGQGFHCIAAFHILNSPVQTIEFTSSGNNIAVGFQSGQVLMLDMPSLSVLFCKDCTAGENSAVISISIHVVSQHIHRVNSPKKLNPCTLTNPKEVVLILSGDSQITIIDSKTGDIICSRKVQPKKDSVAITMHVVDGSITASDAPTDLENCSRNLPDETSQSGHERSDNPESREANEPKGDHQGDAVYNCEILTDPLLILCFADALCLYSLKSLMEGSSNFVHKVSVAQRICWSMTFKVDGKVSGLILLLEDGTIELRVLPGLDIKAKNSLMSILRWSFKTNMDKTMSSSDDGQIAMVNGSEVAFISFLDNQSRFAESMPCLHDKVLAAAAAAAINHSIDLKKRQSTSPGILGGILKGLKGSKTEIDDVNNDQIPCYRSSKQLEELFSRFPFSDQPTTIFSGEEVDELCIDDIEIDDPPKPSTSTAAHKMNKKDEMEREKLFHGSTKDVKPRMRTTQEILTQYKFKGDAAAAAAHAREKLAQRQEKLDQISLRTAELQNDAENFANLAHELVKTMENKKWWKI